MPESSIVEHSISTHKTYLDTLGRTAVSIRTRNLVDDFRDRDIIISYETSPLDTLRKPFIVFGSMMAVYAAAWAVGLVNVGFAQK